MTDAQQDSIGEQLRYRGRAVGEVRAELFRPAGREAAPQVDAEGAPAVLVVHAALGLDAFTRSIAARLARAGYVALAPDLYSRERPPGRPAGPAPAAEADAIRAAAAALPDRRAVGDLEAGAELLAKDPGVDGQSIAAVGFGVGGTLAFLLGCQSRRVAAVVDFYGPIVYPELSERKPVQPLEMALNLSVPLLGFFAGEDSSIPAQDVDAMERTLDQFARSFELVRLPGVGHGFADSSGAAWDEAAAVAAWGRTLAFLAESLGLSRDQGED